MPDTRVEERKRELRAAARKGPEGLPGAAAAAQRRVIELPELALAGTVVLYAAAGGEVPTDTLVVFLATRGARMLFPRVAGEGLELLPARRVGDLRPGYRGIREPGAGEPTVDPREVDLFVVPGVLFDRRGRRLGRGGGHYDRLLAGSRPEALRVGLCYARRLVGELPEAPWDVRMHLVVTEGETIRVGKA